MPCPCPSPLKDHKRRGHPECWFLRWEPLTPEEINDMYPFPTQEEAQQASTSATDPRCSAGSPCWVASQIEYGQRVSKMADAFRDELQRAWQVSAKSAEAARRQTHATKPRITGNMLIPADAPERLNDVLGLHPTSLNVGWVEVHAVVDLVNSWRQPG